MDSEEYMNQNKKNDFFEKGFNKNQINHNLIQANHKIY